MFALVYIKEMYEESLTNRYVKNFYNHHVTNPHSSSVLQNGVYLQQLLKKEQERKRKEKEKKTPKEKEKKTPKEKEIKITRPNLVSDIETSTEISQKKYDRPKLVPLNLNTNQIQIDHDRLKEDYLKLEKEFELLKLEHFNINRVLDLVKYKIQLIRYILEESQIRSEIRHHQSRDSGALLEYFRKHINPQKSQNNFYQPCIQVSTKSDLEAKFYKKQYFDLKDKISSFHRDLHV